MEEPSDRPDDFTQKIVEHVVNGGSMCVMGPAGTGKSVCLRAVIAALEERGRTCQAICLTHTGARNIGQGAMTAHCFVHKFVLHGTYSGQVVLIDEISFMSIDLLAALEHLRLKGVRLLCFGDFRQLPPVCNRWRGQKVPSDIFERSRLFWRWSQGNRFVLRRCRRSDRAHFDSYMRLRDMPLHEALATAHALYPPATADADWHIVLSHYKRKALNEELQQRAVQKETDVILVDGETPYHCFPGTKLIGSNSTLRPIVNGALLLVTKVSPDVVTLKDEDAGGEEFEVSVSQLVRHTRLRWALTLCSVQGRSLKGTVAIHDLTSRHFSTTHLYVALSRAALGSRVSIVRV